jgi:hypothetical protein
MFSTIHEFTRLCFAAVFASPCYVTASNNRDLSASAKGRLSRTNLRLGLAGYRKAGQSPQKWKLCYSRSVCLGATPPSGAKYQFFITVRQLRGCWCWAPSLTRQQVCRLQLLLALASAVIFGSESRGTHDRILLSQIRDFPNTDGKVPEFIATRNRVAQLYPQAPGSLFVASYDSQVYVGGILTRLHTGFHSRPRDSESELLYDWQFNANQFVLTPTPRGSRPDIFFFATEPLQP